MANFIDTWRGGGSGRGAYSFTAGTTAQVPLTLHLLTGQVASGIEIKNALGTTIFSVDPVGNVEYAGSEIITDALTVTGATHLRSTLEVDGVSTFDGAIIVNSSITFGVAGEFVNGIRVTGDSTIEGTTTIHSLFVEGELTLNSGYLRSRYSANLHLLPAPSTITIVGDAGITSHTLNTNDDMLVTGKLEVNGVFYPDGGISLVDDTYFYFGSSSDAGIGWNTAQTVDGWYFGTAIGQNTFIIAEIGDIAYDFAHGAQTNPTIYIQSATQSATEWGSLTHNQTDFVIASGGGNIKLTPVSGSGVTIVQAAGTTGVPTAFTITGAAHTGLTAATEDIGANFNFSATKTWAAGAGPLATQREIWIQGPTYSGNAGGALTITDAFTLYVDDPVQGTNLTLTRTWAAGFNGNMGVGAGTSSLPSLSFIGDPNTGIFSQNADTIGISTGGAEVVRFGTASFITNLIIRPYDAASLSIQGAVADGANIAVKIGNTTALTTAGGKIVSFYSDAASTERAYVDYLGSFNAGAGTVLLPSYSFVGDPNTGMLSYSADIVGFAAGGALKFFASASAFGLVNVPIWETAGYSLRLNGRPTDGATAIAAKIGTVDGITVVGSKIIAFYPDNFTTEKASIDLNGVYAQVRGTVTTTNATATAVTGASITLSDNSVYHIEAIVVGRHNSNTAWASYRVVGTYYRAAAGVATLVGSVTTDHQGESVAGLDATLVVSTNAVNVQVTGIAANTYNWTASMIYEKN